jgi:hypothetical protein
MSPLCDHFVAYQEIPPCPITMADKRVFYAIGARDIVIDVPNGESSTPIRLKDVLHALDMGATIVSISHIAKAGFSVCFEGQSCKIKDSRNKVIGVIPASDNGLYKVDRIYSAVMAPERIELATMHRRLGHIAPDVSWTQSTTSSSRSSKSKVPQVNLVTRPARDPEKLRAHAQTSGDPIPCDQTRSKSPDTPCDQSRTLAHDKSRDPICFG